MKVILGLGNPGGPYVGTRHNVGFEVVDLLAVGGGATGYRSRFDAQVAELNEAGEAVVLAKPVTFMNLSGRCARQILDFYKLAPDSLLVVCDDMALPLGKLRVRAAGSHGGHNGLRNIQDQLGTSDYPRLRIGVDAPRSEAVDHVLGRFRPGEKPVIADAIRLAAEAAIVWVREGVAVCMNRYNGDPNARPRVAAKKSTAPEGDPEPSNRE